MNKKEFTTEELTGFAEWLKQNAQPYIWGHLGGWLYNGGLYTSKEIAERYVNILEAEKNKF